MTPTKACPVLLRTTQNRLEILACERPLAGLQLVKGTIEAGARPAHAAVRELLMSLIVAALVITWVTIIVAHLRFRRAAEAGNQPPRFRAPFTPLSNYLCLAAMALVLGVMLLTPSIRGSALAIPVWIVAVYGAYRLVPLARGAAAAGEYRAD